MIGAIAGDVIGSVYEHRPVKHTEFPLFGRASRFTDDTVLTVAVAQAILQREDYATALKRLGRRYPEAGYGMSFLRWLFEDDSRPYNSWGNGSAMRVSPVGFAFETEAAVLGEARNSAAVTHNHPEGIKGAQATALAVFLARRGRGKEEIRSRLQQLFSYDLARSLEEIRPTYQFDISCQGTVPQAIIAFLESGDYEDAIRKGISLGGDSDTIGSITGGIAQAFYRTVPEPIVNETRKRLPAEFIEILDRFERRCGLAPSG